MRSPRRMSHAPFAPARPAQSPRPAPRVVPRYLHRASPLPILLQPRGPSPAAGVSRSVRRPAAGLTLLLPRPDPSAPCLGATRSRACRCRRRQRARQPLSTGTVLAPPHAASAVADALAADPGASPACSGPPTPVPTPAATREALTRHLL